MKRALRKIGRILIIDPQKANENYWNDYTLNIPKSFKKSIVNNDLNEYIIGVIERYEDTDTILEDFSEHQALTLGRSI